METEETSQKDRLEKFANLVGEAYRAFVHLELMLDHHEENHYSAPAFAVQPFRQLRFLKDFFEASFDRKDPRLKDQDPVPFVHYAGVLEGLSPFTPSAQIDLICRVTRYFFDGQESSFMHQPNPDGNLMARLEDMKP